MQNSMPYDKWVEGFQTTVSSMPMNVSILSESNNAVVLTYTLQAVDNPGGTTYFHGMVTIINTNQGWKIDDIINKPI